MAQREVVVASSVGLHARPATLFTQAAAAAGIPVTIAKGDGEAVNAASILAVLGLGVSHGETVVLQADGDGALRFGLGGEGALTLASPQAMRLRFGDAALHGVASGRFAALQLRVARLAATEAWLRAAGVACERRGAELVVPAHEACGAVLGFRE